MKKFFVFALFAFLMVGAVFVSGCTQKEKTPETISNSETQNQQTENKPSISEYYTGFLSPQKGAWAEWKFISSDGKTTNMRYTYAGKANIDGKESEGFEYSTDINGEKVAAQVWFSTNDRSIVKYVIKYQGKVICYTPPQFEVKPSAGTPSEYSQDEISKKPDISFGTFITESGKTVKVVKFSESADGEQREVWLSSEVPFGIVKIISNGKTTMQLVDFGLSGGQVTITSEEAENCMSLSGFFGS